MSRLAARPDYDADEAGKFIARCREPHTVEWMANVKHGDDFIVEPPGLPIVGGRLTADSSDPYRRRLTLEVGGERWAPKTPESALVPFGQRINLSVRINRQDGTWFPWVRMGEFHIVTMSFERPSLITTVECVDMAGAVDEYLIMRHRSFTGETLQHAIVDLCESAVPEYVFSVDSSDAATDEDKPIKNFVTDAGVGRWEVCTQLAQRKGHECFFDAQGDLIIRHDVTDDDDESIPANGPDIGTVADPVAVIEDGDHGNLIGLTATLSRQGACNGVRINLHSTVPKKVRKKINREPLEALPGDATPEEIAAYDEEVARRAEEGDWRMEWEDAPINAHMTVLQGFHHDAGGDLVPDATSGPVDWGGLFRKMPVVIERDVKDLKRWSNGGGDTWEEKQLDAYQDARRILHRRRGVIRYLDLHALPQYWLEPDDKIRVRWHEPEGGDESVVKTEAHFVQSVEFDIAGGGPMVVRTRQLNTTDPGA